jgi:gas vesicle protein
MIQTHLFKFFLGLLVGSAVGFSAGKYLESEDGKKAKEKTRKKMSEFYEFLSHKMNSLKGATKEKYNQTIADAAHEYGKMKKLSNEAVDDLIKKTTKLWDNFSMET